MGWPDEPSYHPLRSAGVFGFLGRVGDSFLAGLTAGSAYYFFTGFRNSPNGRLAGGARAVRAYAPRLAGSFAALWAVWGLVDTAILLARRNEEDIWNTIATTAATRGFTHARRGVRSAARAALVGGAFAAFDEGVFIVIDDSVLVSPAPKVKRPHVRTGIPPRKPVGEVPPAEIRQDWRWRRRRP
ncbi:mitochondrial import inner membrane translocase subunit TIM17-1 [Setaria italica]|uniref:mitochondrial import inner membrane translocase subunit TIM17-1 n=1 Tax=Setaria italica TaxID=4555 RepID=UPI000350B2AE|nr:mitochondrial import inner membrane translocase subunit TIM17-1 [Setaria italica]